MARFTLLFFIMLVSAVTAFGQSSQSLQGTVTDETGELVMFANVALYNSADNSLIKVETSNETGFFKKPILCK